MFLRKTGIFALIFLVACGPAKTNIKEAPAPQVSPAPAVPVNSIADRFVVRAEKLFATGKLIEPADQNAYTLFRAAQILEPEHEGAKAGLDAILIAKANNVRVLMGSGKQKQAKAELNQLSELYKDSVLLLSLTKELDSLRRSRVKVNPVQTKKIDPSLILLNEDALKEKSSDIIAQLAGLATKVSKTKEGVLIYARSDAQARWIYQKMRQAVPNYRIRGDLRIGRPAVKLLPPFDE